MTDVMDRRGEIENDLTSARTGYGELWNRITSNWRDSTTGNHAWLTYSANYMLSCRGYKWALDPFSMSSRVGGVYAPDYLADLAPLSLVVLTHEHNDHLDLNLVRALMDADIEWVIPANMQELLKNAGALPGRRVITPAAGEAIVRGPIRLIPFESLHIHGKYGVPETGYLVEMDDARWLFPGDIRDYDRSRLLDFGRLDGTVAHLWLGKARALEEEPPLLQAFCDFHAGLGPEQLFISHMNEFGRDERDLWREEHFQQVKAALSQRKPNMRVEKYLMGDRMDLDPAAGQEERVAL
jgi:hypothetical protein